MCSIQFEKFKRGNTFFGDLLMHPRMRGPEPRQKVKPSALPIVVDDLLEHLDLGPLPLT